MEPNTHTHDDDDDVLYMSTHIHTGAMTCFSFSGNFSLSNELYNHSIGGHIYSISYSLLMAVCVCTFFFLVNVTRNVCWFWRLLFRHPSLHHPVSHFFRFSTSRVFRAIPLQTRNKMNEQESRSRHRLVKIKKRTCCCSSSSFYWKKKRSREQTNSSSSWHSWW